MIVFKVNDIEHKILFWHRTTDTTWLSKNTIVKTFLHPGKRRFTEASIMVGDMTVGTGYSICHPSDNFSKKIGRKLALKDACDLAFVDKEGKSMAWQAYLEACKI